MHKKYSQQQTTTMEINNALFGQYNSTNPANREHYQNVPAKFSQSYEQILPVMLIECSSYLVI